MNLPDYYAMLGVSPHASTDDIKKAYRKLAQAHHPDRTGGDGRILLINEAYETLKDPLKRANYDRLYFIHIKPILPNWQTLGQNVSAFFRHAKGQLKNASRAFGEFSDQFRPTNPTLTIDPHTAYHGGLHRFTYQNQTIQTTLPKGLYPNAQIKLAIGQTYVWFDVMVNNAPNITVQGKDIYRTVRLFVWQSALNETLTFEHFGETIHLSLGNINTHSPHRIKGKGIPALPHQNDDQAGDLYLNFVLELPNTPLNAHQIQLLQALKDSFRVVV